MTGFIPLPLSGFKVVEGRGVMVLKPDLVDLAGAGIEYPAMFRVEVRVANIRLLFSLASRALDRQIGFEVAIEPGTERRLVELYLESPDDGGTLVFGNPELGYAEAEVEISGVWAASAVSLPPADTKRIRAQRFDHWFYTTDLGDGVTIRGTFDNVDKEMLGCHVDRAINFHLAERAFGGVAGKRVLDLACSAGLHSFELTRHGARVTAVDRNCDAIEQARFVQECIADTLPRPVEFICSDLHDLDFPPGHFDVIYCTGLFYHLLDPVGAARLMFDACSRGAVVRCCISALEGDVMELSSGEKFAFCGASCKTAETR